MDVTFDSSDSVVGAAVGACVVVDLEAVVAAAGAGFSTSPQHWIS